jgi:glycosyltransferase involved in cell wall biosynthesis
LKVLFFCNLAPRKTGAFEALLVALARAFESTRDEIVYVFACDPIDAVATRLSNANATWIVLDGWARAEHVQAWRFVGPALRLVLREDPDVAVVHFGNELPSLVAACLGKVCRLKVKWVWQQDQQIRDPGVMSARLSKIRVLSSVFDCLVAVYEGGRRSMRLRGVADQKIGVICNSAPKWDRQRTSGWLRQEIHIPDNACLCATVSSLIPRKRVDGVLRAFAKMDCVPAPHLVVVGDGVDRQELEALCDSLHVSERVRFLGLRNDVREILLDADFLIHTATAEACSYAIIESMASGIPAVVTESGAAREQIVDGETGYVMARDDMDGFAVRLSELIRNVELRKVMGAKARQRWRERYRVDVAAAKYHALYRSLTEGSVS